MRRTGVTMLRCRLWATVALFGAWLSSAGAAEPARSRDLLTPDEWRRLDAAVDAGLGYLASQQRNDGSFATRDLGQPGITSLCIMAYLSRGHVPREGDYGTVIDRAIEYVLQTQQPDGLLFSRPFAGRQWGDNRHKAGAYNHAIAGLMLAEVYGMTEGDMSDRIAAAIRRALEFTLAQQHFRKSSPDDTGGWRYLTARDGTDSDLSITAWEVMFLRSARNAEFEIPVDSVRAAMEYVHRTYVPEAGTFAYGTNSMRHQQTRAMAGSGILLLSLGGEYDTEMAHTAGRWVLNHQFTHYQQVVYPSEHYHYSAYYCSQAMFQLGGEYWQRFFPSFMRLHVDSQEPEGSWPQEINRDAEYGKVFTTSLMVLSLTPAYQLLPIYQR
ncbi:MAG: hypothetical protein U0992_22735 [Planctomycetaceae bacterium]